MKVVFIYPFFISLALNVLVAKPLTKERVMRYSPRFLIRTGIVSLLSGFGVVAIHRTRHRRSIVAKTAASQSPEGSNQGSEQVTSPAAPVQENVTVIGPSTERKRKRTPRTWWGKLIVLFVIVAGFVFLTLSAIGIYDHFTGSARAAGLRGQQEPGYILAGNRAVVFPVLGGSPTDDHDKIVWAPYGPGNYTIEVFKQSYAEENFDSQAAQYLSTNKNAKNTNTGSAGDWRYVYGKVDDGVVFQALSETVHAQGHLKDRADIDKFLSMVHVTYLPTNLVISVADDNNGTSHSSGSNSGSGHWSGSR